MDVRLGMLMHENQTGVIQQRAVAFRNGFQLGYKIGEFLHVPAADVAQDALSLRTLLARCLAVGMRVIVVTRFGVAKPWKARQALALGEHVARDACLPSGQRIGQQIALDFRDARPIFHIEIFIGLGGQTILGRQ